MIYLHIRLLNLISYQYEHSSQIIAILAFVTNLMILVDQQPTAIFGNQLTLSNS